MQTTTRTGYICWHGCILSLFRGWIIIWFDRKNPDTAYGLSVSQGVIDHAKVNQGHKDIAVQDVITKQNAETKRVHRRQLKSVIFEKVLHSI